jgi:hypothetical protein
MTERNRETTQKKMSEKITENTRKKLRKKIATLLIRKGKH